MYEEVNAFIYYALKISFNCDLERPVQKCKSSQKISGKIGSLSWEQTPLWLLEGRGGILRGGVRVRGKGMYYIW